MEQITLSLETRTDTGKGIARRLRKSGKLPGVLYGLGHNVSVTVDPRPIHDLLLQAGGRNKILNLKGGSEVEGRHAIIRDYQIDPVKRNLLHVDLLEIDVTKKIVVTVPINIVGRAIGVADGGVLNMIERQIEIKCLPTQIPNQIDVDVTALTIGDSIHLDAIKLPEGVEKSTAANPTLVAVVPPTKEEEAAPSLAPSAEPEVITEKKDASAEGAAPAAEGKDGKKAPEAKKDEKKK